MAQICLANAQIGLMEFASYFRIYQVDGLRRFPSNRSRKMAIPHDAITYKHRNRIERCFNKLKHFRRFATRYDRRTTHFKGFACLAAVVIWLR